MKIIYKKDTKGNIRYLKTWTTDDVLYQETGIVGTENPIVASKVCTPKNVGRSNATSGKEQAHLELESLIAEKKKGGYFDTAKDATDIKVVLPMLAKDYKDGAKKIDWTKPVYAQPKLDGMRCLGKDTLMPREGGEVTTVTHILADTQKSPFMLDGELYAHGLNFQQNMRLIKKYVAGETEKVKYHVYDMVTTGSFHKRYEELKKLVESGVFSNVELVPTIRIHNEKELKKVHTQNLADGYEGTIVRHGEAEYKPNGRSFNLLKYKDFLDLACELVDIEPATQRPTWGVPVLKYKDKTFRAGMKYSHSEREEFLTNKDQYIGKIAEIRFFEYSEDGIPRFPVMVGIRLDKTKADK